MESSIKTRPEAIHFGELVNVVLFPDHWFGEMRSIYFLLLFVDQATGEVTYSEIVPQPGIHDYGFAFWKYLMAYGKPKSFRTDRGSIFKRNLIKKSRSFKLDDVLNIIGVRHCYDSSVSSVGVVVQAITGLRLPLIDGLHQREICSPEEANEFLAILVKEYNAQLVIDPGIHDIHRQLLSYEGTICLAMTGQYTLRQ
jgi:hypothetical protein